MIDEGEWVWSIGAGVSAGQVNGEVKAGLHAMPLIHCVITFLLCTALNKHEHRHKHKHKHKHRSFAPVHLRQTLLPAQLCGSFWFSFITSDRGRVCQYICVSVLI